MSIAEGNNVTYGLSWGHMEFPTKISIKAEPQLPSKLIEIRDSLAQPYKNETYSYNHWQVMYNAGWKADIEKWAYTEKKEIAWTRLVALALT